MVFQLDINEKNNSQNSLKWNKSDISSWKEIKENPFELFKSSLFISENLFNKNNIDSKLDWASEYEIIYNSQLMEI